MVLALVLAGALQAQAQRSTALRDYATDAVVDSEISYKADLVEDLAKPPQLVFYGGSRSQRFDPALAKEKTGLRSFNFAVRNGHPEGGWAIANWLLARAPHTKLRWVWGVQWSTFYRRDMDAGLLQDERFNWYYPDRLLRSQRSTLSGVSTKPANFRQNRTYRRDGLLLWNTYDRLRAEGQTLQESLDHYIARAKRRHTGNRHRRATKSRAQRYFEKTIRLLNAHGTTPVIVMMPVQPRVAAELGDQGLRRCHRNLAAYLRSVSRSYRIKVIDLSDITSFDGDPAGFYDGVHMTQTNSDKALDAIAREAGDALR